MNSTFVPTKDVQASYRRALERFQADSQITPKTKKLVSQYLRDCALGKTVKGRAKKKIGPARLQSYINVLTTFAYFLRKDLDKVHQTDMERFIESLETDAIRSRRKFFNGNEFIQPDKPFSERYKADLKISIRRFYKWLLGYNERVPELVNWIDTSYEHKDISSLTEAEVEKLIDYTRDIMHRALIQVFFDGGLRLGELMSIRLRDVRLRSFDPQDPGRKCFMIWVPRSKTLRRSVSLPMAQTKKWLGLWLEEHPARPRVLEDGTIDAARLDAPLFPLSVNAIQQILRRVGRRAIAKHVHPHLLRHTSATYWCNKLPYFKFCKRFGWTMTSRMPQRYIDVEGIDELEVAQIYHDGEQARLAKENERLRTILNQKKVEEESKDRLYT